MLFVSVGELHRDRLNPIFQHLCGMQVQIFGSALPGSGRLHDQRFMKGSRLLPPPFVCLPNPHYQMYDALCLQHNDAQFTSHTFSFKHTYRHEGLPFVLTITIQTVIFFFFTLLTCHTAFSSKLEIKILISVCNKCCLM